MVGRMHRRLVPWLGAIAGIVLAVTGGEYFASESGEVVVLRTRDAAGVVRETRLWVVDHDGSPWLRAGNPSGGWFMRLSAQPEVEVVRGGETRTFHAQPTPEARDTINDLMQRKYGWADTYVSLLFPRSKKVPVRLLPAGGAP
jgi:hypothetical protein